jgi:serine/threonine protein kinase
VRGRHRPGRTGPFPPPWLTSPPLLPRAHLSPGSLDWRGATNIYFARRVRDRDLRDLPPEEQIQVAVKESWEGRGASPSLSALKREAEVMRRLGEGLGAGGGEGAGGWGSSAAAAADDGASICPHVLKFVDLFEEDAVRGGRRVRLFTLAMQYAAGEDLLQWLRSASAEAGREGERGTACSPLTHSHMALPIPYPIFPRHFPPTADAAIEWEDARRGASYPSAGPGPASAVTPSSSSSSGGDPGLSADLYIHLSVPLARSVARQVLEALVYMHHDLPAGSRCFHRDIKPDNFFIRDAFPADLVDLLPLQRKGRYEAWVRPEHARRRFAGNVIFADSARQRKNKKLRGVPSAAPGSLSAAAVAAGVRSGATTPSPIPSPVPSRSNSGRPAPSPTSSSPAAAAASAPAALPDVPFILIADFDNSRILGETNNPPLSSCPAHPEILTTAVGNYYFRAPEIDDEGYDEKVDLWSVGMFLLLGYLGGLRLGPGPTRPARGMESTLYSEFVPQVKDDGLTDDLLARANSLAVERGRPEGMDRQLSSLLQALLRKDSRARFGAREALRHDFFRHAEIANVTQPQVLRPVRSLARLLSRGGSGGSTSSTASTASTASSASTASTASTASSSAPSTPSARAESENAPMPPFETQYALTRDLSGRTFCVTYEALRTAPPRTEDDPRPGDKVVVKWYGLQRGGSWGVGETPHLEPQALNARRLDSDGRPLRHPHIATIFDVYSQYLKKPARGRDHAVDGSCEVVVPDPDLPADLPNGYPSMLVVMEPASGGPLDVFLKNEALDALVAWADRPERDAALRRALLRSGGELPELAQITVGPRLASHLLRQLLSAIRHMHSRGRVHRDIRMYAVLLRDAGVRLAGTMTFPDATAQEHGLVRVQLELGASPLLDPPHVKLSPVNPIRAGDSYDYTDFVRGKDAGAGGADTGAIDLWAAGDLLRALLHGLTVKQAEAGMVDRERRNITLAPAPVDPDADEVLEALRTYDVRRHGADTVAYIDGVLRMDWFRRSRSWRFPGWMRRRLRAGAEWRGVVAATLVLAVAVGVGLAVRSGVGGPRGGGLFP